MSPDVLVPYLFFGKYAYFTWLMILALVAIGVRVYQRSQNKMRLSRANPVDHLEPLDISPGLSASPVLVPAEDIYSSLSDKGAPADPNERVVWYYQRMLGFLTRTLRISLKPSMTHLEVARMLGSLGYPKDPVEGATRLFERALYSGEQMTESDSSDMGLLFRNIVSATSKGVAHAV